ncbi:MAG: trypsin-like peptidase domain-containing protein [Thiohalomonadales bacterium]
MRFTYRFVSLLLLFSFQTASLSADIFNRTPEKEIRSLIYDADFEEALSMANNLIKKGDPLGHYSLARLYENGYGIEKNKQKSIELYREAMGLGYTAAGALLGRRYIDGDGVEKNVAHGVKLIEEAANTGDRAGEYNLAYLFSKGILREKNEKATIKYLSSSAKKGFEPAMVELARIYKYGVGVPVDLDKENELMRNAEDLGNPAAKYWLAKKYMDERKWKKAYKRLLAPIKLGHPNSQALAGWILVRGARGLRRDSSRGISLMMAAAKKGNYNAYANLGQSYQEGKGANKSKYVAEKWYYKAGLKAIENNSEEDALKMIDRIESVVQNSTKAADLKSKLNIASNNDGNEGISTGTCWVVAPGYIVTNYHVVARANEINITFPGGRKLTGSIKIADKVNDIAIIGVNQRGKLPPAIPLIKKSANVGMNVFTIGYPHTDVMGKEAKLTDGIINSMSGYLDDPRLYQISAPVQSGNSGGPLINLNGEVVGIVTSKLSAVKVFKWTGDLPQNVNYAIKSQYVSLLMSSMRNKKRKHKVLSRKKESINALFSRVRNSVCIIQAK